MNKKPIYLDYQASTPVDPRVFEAMRPYFSDVFGNPHSSSHKFGWTSHKAVFDARNQVSKFINADADEIIFTSGATEANNLALLGLDPFLKSKGKNKIIISSFEHP
ncbi:MAG: IscS subfamily cysteine desulfurase, partial [Micavibrio aeruginosavorus]